MASTRVARTDPGERSPIAIFVNGEPRNVPADWSVSDLLAALAIGKRRVAVAVNGEVVPRSGHGHAAFSEGDRIEILEAVGGG
jgi:sulfur carrier protein